MINGAKDEGKIEVVKNALKEAVTVEIISKMTGLSIKTIKDCKN